MANRKKTVFSEIRESAPDWMNSIPSETKVELEEFAWGDEIVNSSTAGEIGIVLTGVAEIFEQSFLAGTYAYRPIKVLTESSVFGHFELLDDRYIEKSLLESARLHANEKWKIVSGRRCLLPREKLEAFNVDTTFKASYRNGKSELFLGIIESERKQAHTTVAFLKFGDIPLSDEKMFPFLKAAWQHATAYRYCVNSYNFHDLLEFKAKFMKRATSVASKISTTSLQIDRKTFLPLFADAIYDAINRPLRFEPLFVEAPSNSLGKMYWASTSYGANCFFPIDIHNYFISLGMQYEVIHDDNGEKISDIIDVINKVFPKKNFGNSRESRFLMTLAEETLSAFLIEHSNYPFKAVNVKIVQGAAREMLLLHFTNVAIVVVDK